MANNKKILRKLQKNEKNFDKTTFSIAKQYQKWYNSIYYIALERRKTMSKVSYSKLWHLLLERKVKKKDLGLSPSTMSKLKNNECVNTDTLLKICTVLQCQISDIMEVIPEGNDAEWRQTNG